MPCLDWNGAFQSDEMVAEAKVRPVLPIGIRIWIGLRVTIFTATGLYLSLTFSALAWEESRRVFIWLPAAFGSLLIVLFGLGERPHWRNLATLTTIPLCLVGLPWFSDTYTHWYIDWSDNPFFYVGTLIFCLAIAVSVRWPWRSHKTAEPSGKDSGITRPILATKLAIVILGICGSIYGGDYLNRSIHGRFEPIMIGLNGVKSYGWAPRGFVNEFKWNRPIQYLYFGL